MSDLEQNFSLLEWIRGPYPYAAITQECYHPAWQEYRTNVVGFFQSRRKDEE